MIKDRSTFFTGIGILVTFFGILAPIIYGEIREKSELEIKRISSVAILNKPSEIDGLEIFYHKEPITNLNKLTFKITNKSKIAITKSDFISPLNIVFSKDARIISFKIEENNPNNLFSEVKIDSTRKSINIGFELLNPDDYTVMGILYTGSCTKIETQARIKGIKKITYLEITNNKPDSIIPKIILFFIIFSTFLLFLVKREKKNSSFSYSKFMMEKHKYLKYTVEDFSKEIHIIFSHFPSRSRDEIVLKVEQIFNNKNIIDKSDATIDLIDSELLRNIDVNRKANIIAEVIRIVGIIYLIVWLFAYSNINIF